MTERDYAPLSVACVRGLCDKIYEKRKFAGVEIEKMVKDFSEANNTSQIKRLIRVLGQDLMSSTNPNVKNGALMGLSSVAVGLGKGCVSYLPELLQPIAACVGEAESRVRYQAAEALFNVVKMARGAALHHFPLLFDALARLAADPETQVRQAAEVLDRLVKDIVSESPEFSVSMWVEVCRGRLYCRAGGAAGAGAGARQLLVSWVSALDAAPHLDLLPHLPDLLDPLLKMLDDPNPEMRRMCEVQLNEFLRSIKKEPSRADLQAMINILIAHAQSTEELIQLTALRWLKEFLEVGGRLLAGRASGVLAAVLPALAYTDDHRKSIRETAATVNLQLSRLVAELAAEGEGEGEGQRGRQGERQRDGEREGEGHGADTTAPDELNLPAVVDVLTQLTAHHSVHTKVGALEWLVRLQASVASGMRAARPRVFSAALLCLPDHNDTVVRAALAVLADICSTPNTDDLESNPYYNKFLTALLRLLAADESLLEDRGAFIIRQVCVLMSAECVYRSIAAALQPQSQPPQSQPQPPQPQPAELRFAAQMVDLLTSILLTSAELYDLRQQLKTSDSPKTRALFSSVWGCWCHSPAALLALCLLTHNYAHCNALIATFGDLEITVDFLTEIDKLIQLIESPIFAYMRLELLEGAHVDSGLLRGALHGLLMVVPQSEAFHLLRARLQCAPPPPAPPLPAPPPAHLQPLIAQFREVQAQHRRYRMLDRARP